MIIKGIIFDMDGTFLDTMHMWMSLPSRYIISKNKQPEEGLDDKMRPYSMEDAAQYFIDNYGIEGSINEIISEVMKLIANYYKDEAVLREGAEELFDSLKAKGIKMCIATATNLELALPAIKRLGLEKYFPIIFTCAQVKAGKDKPVIYEEALKALGTDKSETLVFEDALYAIKTAKDAGFKVVAIEDECAYSHRAEIKKISDYYITSLKEFDLHE